MATHDECMQDLKAYGFNHLTRYYASLLGRTISFFDWVVFPKKRIPVNFIKTNSRRVHNFGWIAHYDKKHKNNKQPDPELYSIRVAQMKYFQKRHTSLLKNFKHGFKKRNNPRLTLMQTVVMLAAHEVRHRVQFNKSIKRFTRQRKKGLSKIEKRIHKYLTYLLEESLKLAKRRSHSYKRYLADPIEFDAKFIENLMLCLIGRRNIFGKDRHLLKDPEFINQVRAVLLHEPA